MEINKFQKLNNLKFLKIYNKLNNFNRILSYKMKNQKLNFKKIKKKIIKSNIVMKILNLIKNQKNQKKK